MLRLLSEWASAELRRRCGRALNQACEREDASTGEDNATGSTQPWTAWGELLKQHVDRESADPEGVHDTAHEQQRHQEPAATEAVGAMDQAHSECTCQPGPPIGGKEADGRAAAAQAGLLQGGELIKASR